MIRTHTFNIGPQKEYIIFLKIKFVTYDARTIVSIVYGDHWKSDDIFATWIHDFTWTIIEYVLYRVCTSTNCLVSAISTF